MISLDEMQLFLPSYLSASNKKELFEQLAKFADDGSWQPYGAGSVYPEHLLQGDATRDLWFVQLPKTETKQSTGLILSNTCDVDTENDRKIPANVVYCPLIEEQRFESFVTRHYGSEEAASCFLKDSRAQGTTNVIYFPKASPTDTAYYALLDRICHISRNSLPVDFAGKSKVFTLSQVGFYLFLIKISIHFTRLQEGITRS